MSVKADKVVHMIIFLGVSLMKRQELFWQKNNDRKRFITDHYFYKSTTSVSGRQIYLHQCLGWHKLFSLVVLTEFACNHSTSWKQFYLLFMQKMFNKVKLASEKGKRSGGEATEKDGMTLFLPRLFYFSSGSKNKWESFFSPNTFTLWYNNNHLLIWWILPLQKKGNYSKI